MTYHFQRNGDDPDREAEILRERAVMMAEAEVADDEKREEKSMTMTQQFKAVVRHEIASGHFTLTSDLAEVLAIVDGVVRDYGGEDREFMTAVQDRARRLAGSGPYVVCAVPTETDAEVGLEWWPGRDRGLPVVIVAFRLPPTVYGDVRRRFADEVEDEEFADLDDDLDAGMETDEP